MIVDRDTKPQNMAARRAARRWAAVVLRSALELGGRPSVPHEQRDEARVELERILAGLEASATAKGGAR